MRPRTGLAGLCGAIALSTCCAACASPADQLRPRVVEAARDHAASALHQLQTVTPLTRESLTRAITEIPRNENRVGGTVLIRKDVPADGKYTAQYAFVALIGDGFTGGAYEQLAVRLCVTYTGDLSRPGAVEMADLTCPPGLPGPDNGVPVEREIKLAE
jgi:hypothetical protein